MLSNLFGRKPEIIDTRDWHPLVNEALDLFTAKRWTELSLLTSRQTKSSAFRLINALGARSPMDLELDKCPPTPSILAIIGGVQTVWAWRHRSNAPANEIDETRWPRFFETLETAYDHLCQLLEIRNNSPVGLAFMGRVLTGLGKTDELAIVETQFDACEERPSEACAVFLQARSPKWHGDHDAMFKYANSVADDTRLHPARLSLLARAYVERWLYDGCMSDEADGAAAQQRIRSADAKRRLGGLNARFAAEMEQSRQLWSDDSSCRFAHDNLGFALYLAGLRKEAAKHVQALGEHPSQTPWGYVFGDQMEQEWPRFRKSLGLTRRIND